MTDLNFRIFTPSGETDRFPAGGSVVALGTFDGVHTAHRRLLQEAKALGRRLGAGSVGAWCFSESPASVLGGLKIPMLCTLSERMDRMLSLGLDFIAVGDFKAFCSMSAEEFIEAVLKKEMGCIGVACGFNHHFGHRGLGTPSMLVSAFGEDATVVVPEVRLFSETVSSSAIRAHILEGNVGHAALMLGRPFSLCAPVVCGKTLGRTLGFPTANQFFPEGTIIPGRGIYATLCVTEDGKRYLGVSNVGVRPTITDGSDSHAANCETYIHGFDGDLYGKQLTVEFHEWLREERKFASTDALKEQIGKDLSNAIGYFEGRDAELFD